MAFRFESHFLKVNDSGQVRMGYRYPLGVSLGFQTRAAVGDSGEAKRKEAKRASGVRHTVNNTVLGVRRLLLLGVVVAGVLAGVETATDC